MFLDKDIYTHTGHTLTHPHISTQIPHIPQSCERGAKTLGLIYTWTHAYTFWE